MEKFLVLYLTPVAALSGVVKNTDPAQGNTSKENWTNWIKKHADSFIDTGGLVEKTKRVTSDGISDVANEVMGYSIIWAASHEAAASMLKDVHNTPEGSVDVILIMSMS